MAKSAQIIPPSQKWPIWAFISPNWMKILHCIFIGGWSLTSTTQCQKLFYLIYRFLSRYKHRWELPVLHYHKIMVIYPYPFLVVIAQLFSWIIFIHDCICILTGSHGSYLFMIVYVIQDIGGNENSPDSLNVMVNYHYHGENRIIARYFPSIGTNIWKSARIKYPPSYAFSVKKITIQLWGPIPVVMYVRFCPYGY